MKKLSLLIFILFLSSNIYSQNLKIKNPKSEVSFGYGLLSIQEVGTEFGIGLMTYAFDFFSDSSDVDAPVGPVMLRFNSFVSSNISVGATGSYTNIKIKNLSTTDPKDVSTFDIKFYTLIGHVNLNYFPKNIVQLYSGISLGFTYATAKATSTYTKPYNNGGTTMAYHVNALGIRVGRDVGGFLELGLGYNGIINGGFSVKF